MTLTEATTACQTLDQKLRPLLRKVIEAGETVRLPLTPAVSEAMLHHLDAVRLLRTVTTTDPRAPQQ